MALSLPLHPSHPLRFSRAHWLVAAHAALLLAVAWPVLRVYNLALTDYPNHLARMFIDQYVGVSRILQGYYHVVGGFYPYYAMDLVVRPLIGVIGLEPAARVFTALAVTLPVLGTLALYRRIWGTLSLWPALAGLFAYSTSVANGNLTFVFTLGVVLLAFTGWIASEGWPLLRRGIVFALAAAAIFALHILGFGLLGLLLGGWELGRAAPWRRGPDGRRPLVPALWRLGRLALIVLPASLLVFAISHGPMGDADNWLGYEPLDRLSFLLSPVLFLTDWDHLGGSLASEGGLALAFAAIVGGGLATGRLRFAEPLAVPLLVVGLVALLMPARLWGVADMAIRVPLLFCLLLVASLSPRPAAPREAWLGGGALAGLLALRVISVALPLDAADAGIQELRDFAAVIPPGARVLPAETLPGGYPMVLRRKSFWHSTGYLVLDRQSFFPLLFSVLQVRPNADVADLAAPESVPVAWPVLDMTLRPGQLYVVGQPNYFEHWQKDFDFIALLDYGEPPRLVLPNVALVKRGRLFSLYRIIR